MNNILDQLLRYNITQSMIAEHVGVSQSTVCRALDGTTKNRRKVRTIEAAALELIKREMKEEERLRKKAEILISAA